VRGGDAERPAVSWMKEKFHVWFSGGGAATPLDYPAEIPIAHPPYVLISRTDPFTTMPRFRVHVAGAVATLTERDPGMMSEKLLIMPLVNRDSATTWVGHLRFSLT